MTSILTRKVPAWTLMLATALALFGLTTTLLSMRENTALENHIRSQEALVPGFLERTSVLSDEARCRRSLFIRFKDSLTGADSCAQGF